MMIFIILSIFSRIYLLERGASLIKIVLIPYNLTARTIKVINIFFRNRVHNLTKYFAEENDFVFNCNENTWRFLMNLSN